MNTDDQSEATPPEATPAAKSSPPPPDGQDATASSAPATDAPGPAQSFSPSQHRDPTFLQLVSGWLAGKGAPTDEVSSGCLKDLADNAADQKKVMQTMGQIEQALREQQALIMQSQGREDGLLRVLWRCSVGSESEKSA